MTSILKLKTTSGGSISLQPTDTAALLTQSLPAESGTVLLAETAAANAVYVPAGTGAVATTAQEKLRESVSDTDFGAVGDGVTDATDELVKAFEYAVSNGLQLVLTKATYKVTGPVLPYSSRTGVKTLSIYCQVPTVITVDASSTAFDYFAYLSTTAENNVFFGGCSLTFDGSNKCGTFLRCDNNGSDNTGIVDLASKVIVKNLKKLSLDSNLNSGFCFSGPYSRVTIREPEVYSVDRADASGDCSGIVVTGLTGMCEIYEPKISRVLCTPGTTDADGIKVFGKSSGVITDKRAGVCTVYGGVYTDNQGRQFKSQCSEVTLFAPRSIRQNVVTIAASIDFDFQCGNGTIIDPVFIYKKAGATSPIGSTHSLVTFQQLITDEPMVARSIGGHMITEVAVSRYASVIHSAGSKESTTIVDGLKVTATGGLATAVFTVGIIETRADTIGAKSDVTTIELRNCSGPFACQGISYNSYDSSVLTSKLNIVCRDNTNTLTSTVAKPFYKTSGTVIRALKSLNLGNNTGFQSLYGDLDFTVNTLPVGCCISVDLATCVITGGPGWAASGYATFHCIDEYFGATGKSVWAIKGSATVATTMYFTQDGGSSWGQIK